MRPIIAQCLQDRKIVLEKFQQFWFKRISRIGNVPAFMSTSIDGDFNYLLEGFPLLDIAGYIKIRNYEYRICREHINHVLCDTAECSKGLLERHETGFQAFDHEHLVNLGKNVGNLFGVRIFLLVFWLQKFNGSVSCVFNQISKLPVGLLEKCRKCIVHFIQDFIRGLNCREHDALRGDVFGVFCVIEDVLSGATNEYLFQDPSSNFSIDAINGSSINFAGILCAAHFPLVGLA